MEGAARLEAFVRRRRALGVCNFVAVVHGHAAGDLAWVPRWLALAAAGGGRASPDDAPVADWTAVVVTDRAPSCRGVPSVCALRLGSAELRTPPLSVAQCAGAPPVRRRPALAELVDGVAAACGGATAHPACVVLDTLATVWLDHTLSDVAALVRDVAEGATSWRPVFVLVDTAVVGRAPIEALTAGAAVVIEVVLLADGGNEGSHRGLSARADATSLAHAPSLPRPRGREAGVAAVSSRPTLRARLRVSERGGAGSGGVGGRARSYHADVVVGTRGDVAAAVPEVGTLGVIERRAAAPPSHGPGVRQPPPPPPPPPSEPAVAGVAIHARATAHAARAAPVFDEDGEEDADAGYDLDGDLDL